MELYEQFGEFDSYEEINKAAAAQLAEGDAEAIYKIAEENGIDKEDAEDFINGDCPEFCTPIMAAHGKIDVEAKYLGLKEAELDYADLIRRECLNDEDFALAVRKKGKSLIGCIGELLKWSFTNKYKVDSRIIKASGIFNSHVEMGIPGMRTAKKIIREYYLGE